MEPITAFSAISKAINAVKALREFEKKFDAAQYKLQLAELLESLADAKISIVELQDDLRSKESSIEKLRASFQRKSKTIEYDGFSYELNDAGKPYGYPFCNRCMTVDGLMIKVEEIPLAPGGGNVTNCPQCNTKYSTYKAETIQHEFEKLPEQAVKS